MKQIIFAVLTLSISVFLLSGCQESESDIIKRAKLVGNENLQLKQQLAEKDKEIQSLKDEITRLKSEIEKINEEHGKATIGALQLFMESEKRNKTLTTEIEQLKEQLKQLQD